MALKDINAVKRNIIKLRDAGAPDTDIDQYVQEEGYTPEQIIGVQASQPIQPSKPTLGEKIGAVGSIIGSDIAAEIPKAGRTLSALGQMPYTIGKDIYETGKGVVQTIQGKQTPEQLKQRLGAGISESAKGLVEPFTHPVKYLSEQGALASFMNWYPAAKGVGAVGKGGAKVAGNLTLKTLSSTYGVPETFIKKTLTRPKESINAPTPDVYVNKLPEVANTLHGELAQLGELSKQVLKVEKDIPTKNILNTINRVKAEAGKPVTSADIKLVKELNTIENNIIDLGDNLSEVDLKDIIGKVDNSIAWGQEDAGAMNEALQSLRVKVDTQLKSRNTQYAKLMKPEAELINLNKELYKNMGLKKGVGEIEPTPGNNTINAVLRAANPKNLATRKTLKRIGEITGEDLLQQIDDVYVKDQFSKARPAGSKRTNIGIGVGSSLGTGAGYALGGYPGAVTGGIVGTLGGTIVGAGLDTGGAGLLNMIGKWSDIMGKPKVNYGRGGMIQPYPLGAAANRLEESVKGSIGNTKGNVLLGKGNLESEALKYKTPEEFVRSKPMLYHGTKLPFQGAFLPGRTPAMKGKIFFTEHKQIAQHFAGKRGGEVMEVYIDYKKPLEIGGGRKLTNSQREALYDPPKHGYDSIIQYDDGQAKTEVIVYNPSIIKTKSQLTDIWNKVHKGGK
jgi:hypothetical protein